jgi:nicotinamide-nucleotide amidase
MTGEIDARFEELQRLLPDVMVTNRDEPIELVIGKLLLERGQSMCTAESCTGGYIAHLVTRHPGSSKYYKGSIVSYDNQVKEDLLGVPAEILENKGAVSEETVRQMALGALSSLKTDFALAVSGIMGPDGGTDAKPVGTVWVAVANKDEVITQKLRLRTERSRNIELTAINGLNLLRKFILEKVPAAKN